MGDEDDRDSFHVADPTPKAIERWLIKTKVAFCQSAGFCTASDRRWLGGCRRCALGSMRLLVDCDVVVCTVRWIEF